VVEVRVAAAASMKDALEELGAAFAAGHAGVRVVATYGASGTLYAQLSNKAPFDVFLSADTAYPKKLAEAGLAAEGFPRVYARGVLVVWVPKGSGLDIEHRGLKALADPAVKHVAIANPELAPYGRAAEAAMKAAGVYGAVEPRLVRGENVEQAGQFVESGAADVGVLPRSLAVGAGLRDAGRWVEVDRGLYPAVEHGMMVTAWAGHPAEARAFCEYVVSEAGREVLARHGFAIPGD
jgi:molybdate transport system substrate-binding protein